MEESWEAGAKLSPDLRFRAAAESFVGPPVEASGVPGSLGGTLGFVSLPRSPSWTPVRSLALRAASLPEPELLAAEAWTTFRAFPEMGRAQPSAVSCMSLGCL